MSQKRALILGVTGQDGSYLAELLLSKGYEVHGAMRRCSQPRLDNVRGIIDRITLHRADVTDYGSICRVMSDVRPHEVYNLAAQSFVHESWSSPVSTGDITGLGAIRVLDAMRQVGVNARFYQASSSEMYGLVRETPQNEDTPFHPRSPYGVAKVYAHWATVNYRESYDMFCCCGILFNHESSRRGLEFVTRKIANAVARISFGLQDKLYLGNMDALRDWGHARDYVEAMWMMLQQDEPDDYVIATGEHHSVRQFAGTAFAHVGMNYLDYVEVDPKHYRPAEVNMLLGDPSKAKTKLNWESRTEFSELVAEMVDSDVKAFG